MHLELFPADWPRQVIGETVMLNMCLHDCTHMHVRWTQFLDDKIVRGWAGGQPYAEPGAPAVPENQTVFGSFDNLHTFRYRALATTVPAGTTTIFCHHGLGYAIDEWPTAEAATWITGLRVAVELNAKAFVEPFAASHANDKWALFYFRVRFCTKDRQIRERSEFDLQECVR